MFNRKCPKCGERILYTRKSSKVRAEKRNTKCLSCTMMGKSGYWKGKKRSEETRKKLSEIRKGKTYKELYGKEKTKEIRKKQSESRKGIIFTDEHRKNIGEFRKGKTYEELFGKEKAKETRKKMRISKLKYMNSLYGQISPNYNPKTIPIIKEYERKHGFNFQHAENGGEVCIDGYWPDGVDEKRKTIIEVDEKHHFNSDKTLKSKDVMRQNYLENLGYKFIRVRI